jgi:hypothetical protein
VDASSTAATLGRARMSLRRFGARDVQTIEIDLGLGPQRCGEG